MKQTLADRKLRLAKRKVQVPNEQKSESRAERVAAIKAKVQAGTYVVDPAEVSRKIVDAHLVKKAGSC